MSATTATDAPPDQFPELVAAVLDLLDRAAAQPELTADEEGWRQAAGTADRLRQRSFLIAVCGEFSSGKSTLLGALLRRPELFPADVGASTSAPTVVRWGETEQILVATRKHPDGLPVAAADLPRYVTEAGNPGNAQEVLEVQIRLPSPLLADGVGFVDLPGIGSTNAAHALVTNGYLERIDAALFVSAAQTVSESEVTFLRRVTDRVGDALVIARSKSDLVAGQYGEEGVDRAVADIRTKAAAALDTSADSLVIVPVSAHIHQMALGDADEEAASNIPALEASIDTAITARAGSLLATTALVGLEGVLAPARERLGLRLTALEDGNSPEIVTIRQDLADRRRRLDEVTRSEGEWTLRLRRDVERVCADESHRLNSALHRIRASAGSELDAAGAALDANAFTSSVLNRVHDTYASSARHLERRVNQELAEAAGELGLELDLVQVDSTFRGTRAASFHEPAPTRRQTSKPGRVAEAGSRAVKKGGFFKILGAAVGVAAAIMFPPAAFAAAPLIGAVAGAAAGGAAGALADAGLGLRSELEEMDRMDLETRRARLRKHVVDALAPNQDEASARLRVIVQTLQRDALETLRRALSRARHEVSGQIGDLDRDLRRTEAEAKAEAVRLRPRLTTLESLADEASRLRAGVGAAQGRLPEWPSPQAATQPPPADPTAGHASGPTFRADDFD